MTGASDFPMPMDRRTLLERMALLLGVTALPIEALAADVEPLSTTHSALISAVVDTLLPTTDTPGALEAGVPARFEGLLANWASTDTRASLIAALDRIDAAAIAETQRNFASLTLDERSAVLRPHDAVALASAPAPARAERGNLFSASANVVDPAYLKIKELVINLYYLSPIAVRTELPYTHVPGAFQPSVRLAAESRPEINVGPF